MAGSAALLGLSACGVANSDDPADDPAGSDSGTRTLSTDNGEIEVPTQPERVVVVDNWTALMLLDIDLVPVGIPDGIANEAALPPEVYAQLKDVKTIGPIGSPNAQAVGALNPDLILDQFYPDQSEPLSTVAPVVYFNWQNSGALWYEQVGKIAGAVNRTDQLAATKTEFETKLNQIKEDYADQIEGGTWATLSGGPNGTFFLGSPLLTVLRQVGLTIGAGIPDDEAGFVEHSLEELDILNDCTVLVYPTLFAGQPPAPTAELLNNPLWQSVSAVSAGHVYGFKHYAVGSYRWAIGALDEIEQVLRSL